MADEQTFDAVVQRPDDGSGHALAVPFDPVEVFGRVRAPVLVSVAGHAPFRTTLASYGGTTWIGLRKAQLRPDARAAFDRLSFSHRREYAQWVGSAKRVDTRARRASATVDRLLGRPI